MNAREEAKQITGKLSQLNEEIKGKQAEIEQLRKDNAGLIERNLGKSRKSPALRLGREKIASVDNEIAELNLVKDGLQKRLDNANAAIRQEQLKVKISQFMENSKEQLMLIETVRRNIKSLELSITALEGSSGKQHCLYQLLNLCWDFPDTKKMIKLDTVLMDWAPDKVVIDVGFDGLVKRLDRMRVDTTNFWNQLGALRENKRAYHKVKPMKQPVQQPGTIHDVRQQMAAKEAEEYRELQKKQPKREYINHNEVARIG